MVEVVGNWTEQFWSHVCCCMLSLTCQNARTVRAGRVADCEMKASGLSTEGGFGRRARNGTCNLYLKVQAKDYDI